MVYTVINQLSLVFAAHMWAVQQDSSIIMNQVLYAYSSSTTPCSTASSRWVEEAIIIYCTTAAQPPPTAGAPGQVVHELVLLYIHLGYMRLVEI